MLTLALFLNCMNFLSLLLSALILSLQSIPDIQEQQKVVFRIQLGTATKMPDAGSKAVKDFPDVEGIKLEDGVIRLYTGKYETFSETEDHVKLAISKGYKYAAVVAFYKGKRISVDKALEIIYEE
jgi:hypothetical protein